MTIAQRVSALERNLELMRQSGEFIQLCRCLLQSKGQIFEARQITERVSPRVRELIASDQILNVIKSGGIRRGDASDQFLRVKAAQSALSLDSGAFATYALLVSGFLNALSSSGIFDALLSSMRSLPLGRTIGAVSTAATAYTVSEGSAKQVSRLSLTNGTLLPQKAHCIVALSNELLKIGGPAVDALITKELINAATLAVDAAFFVTLTTGLSVASSTGQTAAAVRADLANLFAAVPTDQTSKLFILTTPAIAKNWSAMGGNGPAAFPEMGPSGGSIMGVPVLISDGIASGTVILVDANGIAAGSDTVVVSTMSEGTIMPDTAPDSPQIASTNVVSLWQSNLSALLVERWFGVQVLRSNAVAAVLNSNSYGQGFSPP